MNKCHQSAQNWLSRVLAHALASLANMVACWFRSKSTGRINEGIAGLLSLCVSVCLPPPAYIQTHALTLQHRHRYMDVYVVHACTRTHIRTHARARARTRTRTHTHTHSINVIDLSRVFCTLCLLLCEVKFTVCDSGLSNNTCLRLTGFEYCLACWKTPCILL